MNLAPTSPYILTKCIEEPQGYSGLEGYQKKRLYRAQFMLKDKDNKPYYRMFPDTAYPDYYETCSVQTFHKFFEELT